MTIVKMILSLLFLAAGMVIFLSATIGANRFHTALNRIHSAALGDTLGILLTMIALFIWKGFCFASFKMLIIIIFFWLASPVCSHMLAQLDVETNEASKALKTEYHEKEYPGREHRESEHHEKEAEE